jgi:hypothetical protein
MCFSSKISLFTFFIGTTFSLLLIKYGNPKYKRENITSGIFLIFISMIQFMDFLFWIDLKNKLGINKIVTILGPILNVGQPVIFYLIKYVLLDPTIFSLQHFNLPVFLLNCLYFLYFLINYSKFLSKGILVTSTSKKHLIWPWIQYFNPSFYLILFAINIFYLFNFKYALVLFSITYFFLFLSVKFFHYNVGELWCFLGSFIPFIMFFVSYLI